MFRRSTLAQYRPSALKRGRRASLALGRAPLGPDRRAFGNLLGGPVGLEYSIAGLGSAGPPLLTLRRFLALCSTGRFSRMLHPLEPRARRWVLMLRAWDALQGGAGQREIAEVLLSRSAGEPRWRVREPSVRLQAQRLVRSARAMGAGGYRHLLGHPRISGPELNERELVRRPRRQGLGQKEP